MVVKLNKEEGEEREEREEREDGRCHRFLTEGNPEF